MTAPAQNAVIAPLNRLMLGATGTPKYLGSIVTGTTSATNGSTANPFSITGQGLAHKSLIVVPSTSTMRFYPVATSTSTVTNDRAVALVSGNFGFPMPNAGQGYEWVMDANPFLAAIDSTTAGFLDVWEMVP